MRSGKENEEEENEKKNMEKKTFGTNREAMSGKGRAREEEGG